MKLEKLVVKAGIGTRLNSDLESKDGKYLSPEASEIVVVPWTLAGVFGARRIALYPENAPKPWPVAKTAVIEPGSFTAADFITLFGPFLPTLLRRALFAALENWRTADKVNVILLGIVLLLVVVCGAGIYKLGKFAGAW